MIQAVSSDFKLGITAGGQLGKMLVLAASNWDIQVSVMDRDPDCPAAGAATFFVQGDPENEEDLYQFGKSVDLLTFELENVNIDALYRLKREGVRISPDPEVMGTIKDKGLQKTFYREHHLPTSDFCLYRDRASLLEACRSGHQHLPFVQKLRTGGYDGRGVHVVRAESDLTDLLDGPSVAEDLVDIDREIAVIAARNSSGSVVCFPAVDMVFNPEANLVERLVCPADLSQEHLRQAESLAVQLISSLQVVGLLAVEMFIDREGKVWINEAAPRPHNSGHHTIESTITSQYEQLLRAIIGFPLGSTAAKMPAVMINLLGEPGYDGPVRYEGLEDALGLEGVKVHLYGKRQTRPFRKMGHVTVLSESLTKAVETADRVRERIKVKSWKSH